MVGHRHRSPEGVLAKRSARGLLACRGGDLDEEGLEDLQRLQLLRDAHPVEVVDGEAGDDPRGVGEVGRLDVERGMAVQICAMRVEISPVVNWL